MNTSPISPATNRSENRASICTGFFVAVASLSALLTLLIPNDAHASFYKCIDANGGVTYSTSQCPSDEKVAKVIQRNKSQAALDCRIARNFTQQVSKMVVSGKSPDSAFNRYGGINYLSPTAIGLINYLYSFKDVPNTSAPRMSNLAISRCENGSFGPSDCDQFPQRFIEELGGCEGALIPGGKWAAQYGQNQRPAQAYQGNRQEPAHAAARAEDEPADPRAEQSKRKRERALEVAECKAETKAEIEDIRKAMREAGSVSSQDKLREKRRQLSRRLSNCS